MSELRRRLMMATKPIPVETLQYIEITGEQAAAIVIPQLPLGAVAFPIVDITMYRGTSNPSNYPLIRLYGRNTISVRTSNTMVGTRMKADNTEQWEERNSFTSSNRYVGARLQAPQTKGYGLYYSVSSSGIPTGRSTRGSQTTTTAMSMESDNSLEIFYDRDTQLPILKKGTKIYGVKVWTEYGSHSYTALIPDANLQLLYNFVPAKRGIQYGLLEQQTGVFYPTTHGTWTGA